MADEARYIAIDLGAGSGRVFSADLAGGGFALRELRRFTYAPREADGHLRWDFKRMCDEIRAGLLEASDQADSAGSKIGCIGVDSWGVDYGLVDSKGRLIEDPVCYRDGRTQGVMERVLARITREEAFERTGIQFLPFNTLFQLYAHAESGIPDDASRLLMIPDLVNLFLTGRGVTEFTNGTTTQMINVKTGAWDWEMIDRLGLPSRLLGELVPASFDLGPLKPALADELRLAGVKVIAPATHDTGSAVAGIPIQPGWAYISSGTWSLVGIEREAPLVNSDVATHNFTNEGGVFGTTRFLKNVMGLWILVSCRDEWRDRGVAIDYGPLLNEVASVEEGGPLIYPDDDRFFNPPSMLDAISRQLEETGSNVDCRSAAPAAIAKAILDSLALRYASVLRTIESLAGREIRGVHIVGGGSRNDYLNQATATASGLPVRAGPVEATVAGNVLVQAISAGRFRTIGEARRYLGDRIRAKSYEPRPSSAWAEAAVRYGEIERRYLES